MLLALCLHLLPLSSAEAGDRKALVIGIGEYSNGLAKLLQAPNDADQMAAKLASKGFDFAVTRLTAEDVKDRKAFDAAFKKFLGTVGARDEIVVYISSHGYGDPEPKNGNCYFLSNAQSRAYFTNRLKRDRAFEDRVKKSSVGEERLAEQEFTAKLPEMSIGENEIIEQLREKNPGVILLFADACRTYLPTKDVGQDRASSANLHAPQRINGVFRFYSAGANQASQESPPDLTRFGTRPVSVFTGKLLLHLNIPMTIHSVAAQIALAVTIETNELQKPTFSDNFNQEYQLYTGTDGGAVDTAICSTFDSDFQRMQLRRQRNALNNQDIDLALAKFGRCGRDKVQALRELRDSQGQEVVLDDNLRGVQEDATIEQCDAHAASPLDQARPQRVRGVDVAGRAMAARATLQDRSRVRQELVRAISVCTEAVANAPKIVRFKFNLARAYHAASIVADTPEERLRHLFEATRYNREAADDGYAAAYNNLAYLYDSGLAVEDINGDRQQLPRDPRTAFKYYTLGAERNHLVARYNLGIKLREGDYGEPGRVAGADLARAYRQFSQAADAGYVPAIIETGLALRRGRGIDMDPQRALQVLENAARRGSGEAMFQIGLLHKEGQVQFILGKEGEVLDRKQRLSPDFNQALIWMTRAAETGHVLAMNTVADMLRAGQGIPVRQPEVSARYMRLAANAGSVGAQAALAEMLQRGEVDRRPNEAPDEIVKLYRRAEQSGHAGAAMSLARIYDTGLVIGSRTVVEADRDEAVRLAQRAYLITSTASAGNFWSQPQYLYEAASLLIHLDSKTSGITMSPSISELRETFGDHTTKARYIFLGAANRSCDRVEIALWPSKRASPLASQIQWYEQARGCQFWKRKCDYLRDVFEQAKKSKGGDMADLIDFDKLNEIDREEAAKEEKRQPSSTRSEENKSRFTCDLTSKT